jgi:hypothetical protein
MVKVTYGSTGNIIGYYPDDIDYPSIPKPYIKIDEAIHRDCMNNPGLRRVDTVNKVIVNYTPPGPTLAQVQQQQFATINTTYSTKLNGILTAIIQAQARGAMTTVTVLQATYNSTQTAWKAALQVVTAPTVQTSK